MLKKTLIKAEVVILLILSLVGSLSALAAPTASSNTHFQSAAASSSTNISTGNALYPKTFDIEVEYDEAILTNLLGLQITNGDFETGDLSGWTSAGELPQAITSEDQHSGNFAALLGDPTLGNGAEGNIPAGNAYIEQIIQVPSDGIPQLSFWYRLISYDIMIGEQSGNLWDSLDVTIDGNQEPLFRTGNPASVVEGSLPRYDSGWEQAVLDISAYRGQSITLRFAVWNREYDGNGLDYFNTWAYIDDVTVSPSTPGPSPTATPTPTATSTPTPTPVPSNPYEPNDTCEQASSIPTDGTIQVHTFHEQADSDWVQFDGTAGTTYLIEARVPDDSLADVVLELYKACGGNSTPHDSFGPTVRLQFDAPSSGPYYINLTNYDPEATGADVNYQLSVRALNDEPTPGALVLVAGRLRANDNLQSNIHQVTNDVYRLFLQHGYTADRIYYLATDLNLDADNNPATQDVDAVASRERLEYAITQWATDESLGLGPDRALTLYMMSHGDYETFFLNTSAEQVAPDEIDSWLSTLEEAAPGVKVNVIVEACLAGSFIDLPLNLSKPGRLVIASTTNSSNAYASPEGGAFFSDIFVQALDQEMSLYSAFVEAQEVAQLWHPDQVAWLDDNGDGQANGLLDGQVAQLRGFAYAGSFAGGQEPPYIAWANGPTTIDNRRGQIEAHVRDDVPNSTLNVWAVIYEPSYTLPPAGQEIILEEDLPTVRLQDADGDNVYSGEFAGFDQMGSYRIVVYAVDENGLQSRPRVTLVQTGYQLYLPAITR